MKITFLALAAATTLMVGCATDGDTKPITERKDPPPVTNTTPPDNTGHNERDQSGKSTTPMDQGENAADLEVTQKIRKAVMAADNLSMNAKNIKIVTANQKVTLRGVVASADEKKRIVALANANAGKLHVTDMLEIAPK